MGNLWGTFNKNINHTNNMIDPIAMTSPGRTVRQRRFRPRHHRRRPRHWPHWCESRGSHRTQPRSFLPIMVIAITLAALIEGVALISIFVK